MSKRGGMWYGHFRWTLVLFVIFLASLFLPDAASAQYVPDYQVRFFVPQGPVDPGSVFELQLRFWDPDSSFQAKEFYIQISYPDSAVTPVYAAPGDLLGNCGWSLQAEYPSSGLIKLHGKAPEGADSLSGCYLQGAAGTLASIYMQAANDSSYRCKFFPLGFYWESCEDNIFITPGEDSVLLSEAVYSEVTLDPYPLDDTLPTYHGAPDICLDGAAPDVVYARKTNFNESGFVISCLIFPRGDLNLNQIAYEIADYNLYADFFLYGIGVFAINPDWQVALSDVNCNGIVLTPDDMVYMNRVMIGDAMPFEKGGYFPWPDTADFIQDASGKKVSLISPDSLGAATFIFDGEITPQVIDLNGLQMSYSHVDGKTHVLIFPYGQDRILYAGDLFSYTGFGLLQEGEASDCEGLAPYAADITISGEIPVCGDADGNGEISITDVVWLINCIFLDDQTCPPIDRADANCDNTLNVSDVVWLLSYIFLGGNSPCDLNGDGNRDC
jgi:hypothetical protein